MSGVFLIPPFRKLIPSAVTAALVLFSLLVTPAASAATLFDDFNSHQWYSDSGWAGPAALSRVTFDGHKTLKIVSLTPANALFLLTRHFPDEDWQNVDLVRMDVFLESGNNTTQLTLQPRDNTNEVGGNTANITFLNVPTAAWTDCVWDVSIAQPVSQLSFIPDALGGSECTYYFDNLRLVMQDGTTWYWDDFDAEPKNWSIAGDAVSWSAFTKEPDSHLASTDTLNAGAGYLRWQFDSDPDPLVDYAELSLTGLNEDWTSYNFIRADVRCSDTGIPVKFYVVSGAGGANTASRFVTAADTWETLYWPLPAVAASDPVTEFKPGVLTGALHPSGTCYFDNITVGRIDLAITKSTSTAAARPGQEITITLTYANPGDMNAPGALITEAIPFNTYVSEAVTASPADSVEYYVGSAWQGSYANAATKLRWRDASVPPGSHSVSYKVKVR